MNDRPGQPPEGLSRSFLSIRHLMPALPERPEPLPAGHDRERILR
ncbi:hypothetical protein DESPIG_01842 [Desulfovibrio piger ATCC 29098]|uniref:Uncharacterized protein n=1 Tax=Desulfovibrio piger ATCC 29098 TaxID=411464 RepID=B6WUT1_9BACT|nr:hypothetical protein DESPIG_01842 [Desulfovibrio piger ATCC 29098]